MIRQPFILGKLLFKADIFPRHIKTDQNCSPGRKQLACSRLGFDL